MKKAPEFCNNAHRKNWNAKAETQRVPITQELKDAHLKANYKQGSVRPEKTKSRAKSFNVHCPHPYKKSFVTTELAEEFIHKKFPDDETMEAYKCRCGTIHIGHPRQTARPKKTDTVAVSATADRQWCAYPKKTAFASSEEATSWAEQRYLKEHYTAMKCTCDYFHLKITASGRVYRDKQIRSRSI